ncbi:VWA domain-containing protein, partial [Vibrio navarrensis]
MSDLIFLHPQWLFALIVIPVAILIQASRKKWRTGPIAAHLLKDNAVQRTSTLWLWLLAWTLTIVALASPSWQKNPQPSFDLAHNRVLLMDMSRSMYADDISPSRLQQAKYKALDLLPKWQEGSTALVAYAADAYLLSPLTSDSKTLANLVENLSPELMPFQGSNLASALQLALTQLQADSGRGGDIVLISDDVDDNELQQALTLLQGHSVRVSVLMVGTPTGAPVRLPNGSLLTNAQGQPIVAQSNLTNMAKLAAQTGGIFLPVQHDNRDIEQLAALSNQPGLWQQVESRQQESGLSRVNGGFWLMPLILGLSLLMFRKGIFWMVLIALPLAHTPNASASPFLTPDQQGKAQFDAGEYQAAQQTFSDPLWKGAAAYQAGDYAQAAQWFSSSDSAAALYNLGNALAKNGQFDDAISAYQQALTKQPDLSQAQANLEAVKK